MVIAVNTRFLPKDCLDGYGSYIYETFSRLAKEHPEHKLLFIFDRPHPPKFVFSGNVVQVVGPQTRNPFFRWWWFKFRIPKILKKYKADIFVGIHELRNKFYWVSEKFHPIHFDEREQMKEKYADDNEYFLCTGNVHPAKNLVILLKAFSLFKKRQKSGMQLLIAVGADWKNDEFLESLRLFKFRDDVKVQRNIDIDELAKITAAAYTTVYPSSFEGFGMAPLESMRAGVPVLTSNISAISEICGDAALYFDPNDPADISQKMMMIYKDEKLRKEFIEKGFEQVKNYSWEKTSVHLWKQILATEALSYTEKH